MKFLCVECDEQMRFEERRLPGDGTLAAAFRCPRCGRVVAMLTNPMETQLVSSLGVQIGGRTVPEQALELVRGSMEGGREDAFEDAEADAAGADTDVAAGTAEHEQASGEQAVRAPARVTWSVESVERLNGVPAFVRGMVKRIYTDYARERGIERITPAVMDRARSDLGLEGM